LELVLQLIPTLKEAEMSATSVRAAASLLSLLLFSIALPAQTTDAAPQNAGNSKVRIVRLSEVRGDVQIGRLTGQGLEAAVVNLPVVEQNELLTKAGIAEVEFEDNSTLRIAPYSEVSFTTLERLPTGQTSSEVHLLQGIVYVSVLKKSSDQFTLDFGQRKIQLQPATHVRLQIDQAKAELAVLDGTVHIDQPGGAIDVPRKKTISFSLQAATEPEVKKEIASETFDSWDHQSAEYHARAATFTALGNAPYAYGLNDMMYYGSFMNAGGCGQMWRPYFASAAWDPYSNGTWAWYQNAGYSWVSPYPWGWTPYHYGSWSYCPNIGWGWIPGGGWNGLNNVAAVSGTAAPVNLQPLPHRPVDPPRQGHPTLTPVNVRPVVESNIGANDSFVFRRDSAGLGIPREGLGKLDGFSHNAVQHGTASTPVFLTAESAAHPGGRTAAQGGNLAPVMVHRGQTSAPNTLSPMPSNSGAGHPGNASQGSAASTPRSASPGPVSGGAHTGGGGGGGQMGGGGMNGGGAHPSSAGAGNAGTHH
jgi:hypothetical protein